MKKSLMENFIFCAVSRKEPVLSEPQNNPYWLMKSDNISKCRGWQEELEEIILGRLELDFFPK